MGERVFENCSILTSITIPNSLTYINNNAFHNCPSLIDVSIPNGINTINYGAFHSCIALTNIILPKTITNIEDSAFRFCSNLLSVTVLATTPPTMGNSVFGNNASGRKIYVPAESVDTYKAATKWASYAADIEPISTP